MTEPDLTRVLINLDGAGAWPSRTQSCLSQDGVDWLSHVCHLRLMRRGVFAHDLTL
jgi:hypothetical protein